MKQKKVRLLGLLLAAVMLLGCLPVQALAAEGGWFYLAADWNGTLLIAPERISYTADQTLYEALNASGHSFGPDENSVTQIDGKTGNFIRSDETREPRPDAKRRAGRDPVSLLHRQADGAAVGCHAEPDRCYGRLSAGGAGCAAGRAGGV